MSPEQDGAASIVSSRLLDGVRRQKAPKIPEWEPLPARRLRCYKCGYEWDTESKLKYVTCPSCHYKIDSSKCVVAKEQKDDQ